MGVNAGMCGQRGWEEEVKVRAGVKNEIRENTRVTAIRWSDSSGVWQEWG